MESIKINKLEIENVKRVKAVKMKPSPNGLTIIGGNNNQGKTSVIDAIAWALGGEKYRPSQAQREGSAIPPSLHIVLSNGLVVERKGKNSTLKVTDPAGQKAGQQLLNEFVEQFALDLPKFMYASGKEKADALLRIIGIGGQLAELEQQERELYNERLAIGRIADQKKKFAEEQAYFPDAPVELVSAAELIRRQQEILAKNGENQRKRDKANQYKQSVAFLKQEADAMQEQLKQKEKELEEAEEALRIAMMDAADLQDQSTAELEASIQNIEELNRKVRINMDKDKAEEDANQYIRQYDELTGKITDVREKKAAMLQNTQLPLPGLSVSDGELVYHGQKWDNMSGSDQMKVSTAIVRQLNPHCGFVLLDKLEQMDMQTLNEFGSWLEQENLQVIATRVSTGEECSIIIEDGYVKEAEPAEAKAATWKAGEF